MRMVVAFFLQKFDMKLVDGFDPQEWLGKMNDWLVAETGELPVVFTPRS